MVVSARRPWPAPLSLAAGSVALACGSAIPERSVEVDCSADDQYEHTTVQAMEGLEAVEELPGAEGMEEVENLGDGSWFSFGDATPGGVNLVGLRRIPEGRCDSAHALVLTANGHTDWGAGFSEYLTPMSTVNASQYEGISFWARATGYGTSTGFQLAIHDRNTYAEEVDEEAPEQPPAANRPVCTVPEEADIVEAYMVNEAGVLVAVGGELPGPNDCGNAFVRVVTAQRDWRLHRLPFESFQQQALPNRKPGGLDKSALFQFAITIPKDSNIELWIDDLGLYRRR